MRKLDILLVNPSNRTDQFAELGELATIAQPVGISSIAHFLKERNINVEVFDAEAEGYTIDQTIDYIKSKNPRIMGISAFTTKMTSATKIIQGLKNTKIKTVLGGHHASAIPTETLKETNVNYIIRGEGYTPLLKLARWYRNVDQFQVFSRLADIEGLCWLAPLMNRIDSRNIEKFDTNYFPEYGYEFLNMNKYRAHHWQTWGINTEDRSGFAIVYSSLGCPFKCDYCTVNLIYGENRVRYKDPEKFVSEIEYLNKEYGTKYFEITDDTFTFNKDRVLQICNKMIKKGLGKKIHAWCFGRVSTVNKNILSLLKEAGIDWIFFGFESSSEYSLKGVNKNQTVDQMFEVREMCKNIGINVGGNFLYGLPEDTCETMVNNLKLAKELNCEYVNFFLLMPYPGTKYYDIAKKNNYPLPKTWNDYGFFAPGTIPMTGKYITARGIVEFRDKAFNEYFSSQNYQDMIKSKFGQETLDFINNKILTKKIKRDILC